MKGTATYGKETIVTVMDMSDPRVQAMLEADKQEALARIRAKKAKEGQHSQ